MVHKNKKYGFTIVEICIACIVFALLLGAAYKIFAGASKGFRRSTTSLKMQNEMRNGLNFVREEMQRASYKSEIAINGNTIYENDYKFKLCKDAEIDGKSNKVLAQWKICKPFFNGGGVVFNCTLRVTDNKIFYTKEVEAGSDSTETTFQNKAIMTQIGKIRLSTEEFTAGTSSKGALVNIETFAVNSTSGQADLNVSAQTGARVEVEVLKEL